MLVLGLSSCGGRPPQQQSEAAGDTASPELPPPPQAENAAEQPPPVADEEYVIHGACPFECCKYGGNWTMLEGGVLRSDPNQSADSVGSVATGATVRTDSGVMVLHPPGLAVIVADTSASAGAGTPRSGDTVAVISYTGQKTTRVRWNGQEIERNSGLRMLRDPVQRWWIHVTDPTTLEGGWLQVSGVSAENVGAPKSCSGANANKR